MLIKSFELFLIDQPLPVCHGCVTIVLLMGSLGCCSALNPNGCLFVQYMHTWHPRYAISSLAKIEKVIRITNEPSGADSMWWHPSIYPLINKYLINCCLLAGGSGPGLVQEAQELIIIRSILHLQSVSLSIYLSIRRRTRKKELND